MGDPSRSGRSLTTLNIIGILALFCTMSEFAILTPSIAAFSHHFADTPTTTIMLANSVTGIVSVPVSIAAGAILHKVGFKPMAVIGILIMSLGGAFPFLLPDTQNYLIIIGSRIVVGFGLGIMFPVGNASIIALTEGEQRSRLLGWGVAIQFLFNLIYTTVAGYLTEIGWNYSFLAYLIGLVPMLIALLWMPEAKHVVAEARERERLELKGKPKSKIPNAVWGYALFGLATWTCVVTVQVVTSTILDIRGLAGPSKAALVINCCGIGTIICGVAFPYLVRAFKTRIFGVGALIAAVGMIPCLFASSAVVYAAGVFLLGFGGSMFFTAAQNAAGNVSPADRVPFTSGVMTSMMNLGPFIGPYIYSASLMGGDNAIFPVLMVIAGVCAVVGLVHPMRAIMMKPAAEQE